MTDALLLSDSLYYSASAHRDQPLAPNEAQREQRQQQLLIQTIVQLFFRSSVSQRLHLSQGERFRIPA